MKWCLYSLLSLAARFDRIISLEVTSLHIKLFEKKSVIKKIYNIVYLSEKKLQWISAVTQNKASAQWFRLDFYPLFCRPCWIPWFRDLGTKVRHVSSFLKIDWFRDLGTKVRHVSSFLKFDWLLQRSFGSGGLLEAESFNHFGIVRVVSSVLRNKIFFSARDCKTLSIWRYREDIVWSSVRVKRI